MTGTESEDSRRFVLSSGLAGGVAGVSVDFILFPVDTIKTQIQASNNKVNFRQIAMANSLYKGFSAQLASAFPFAFLYFFTYEELKRQFKKNFGHIDVDIQHIIAAGIAEMTGNTFRTPFEVVKQQQQIGLDKTISETIRNIIKANGIRGFYAGFSTLLMRDIPYSMIQYPVYDRMRRAEQEKLRLRNGQAQNEQVQLSFIGSMKCGAVAASLASFLTTPLDVIKTKLMVQRDGYYKGPIDAFRKVIQEEGALALFKGVRHRVLPLSFTGTIYFTVYEQARNYFNTYLLE